MEKPSPNYKRHELISWLEQHGTKAARKAFLDNAFDPKAKRLSDKAIYDLCEQSYEANP